jgi:hypothetical protein
MASALDMLEQPGRLALRWRALLILLASQRNVCHWNAPSAWPASQVDQAQGKRY